jgi:choline dehydrogenase-like flavoprotein
MRQFSSAMTAFIDLESSSTVDLTTACDVCIIGAGAAGLYLGSELARIGKSVVLLEAGGKSCQDAASLGFDARFAPTAYPGAIRGRAFGLGGTTSRWGGLLIPHGESDITPSSDRDSIVWAHIVKVAHDHCHAVRRALGMAGVPDFFSFPDTGWGRGAAVLRDAGLRVSSAEFLPLTRRNLTFLANRRMAGELTVYLHAVAVDWSLRSGGSAEVTAVNAISASGKRIRVSADAFVIAAGTIESTRVLMEIDRMTRHNAIPQSAALGCNLSDHLSCAIADVSPASRASVVTLFAPLFAHGRMRTFRFTESGRQQETPRHFAHFVFDSTHSGFLLAKEVLSRVQARQLPTVSFKAARAGASGLVSLAYARYVKSRLHISKDAKIRLQLDVEQRPSKTNSVRLTDERDRFGRPIPIIRWEISESDRTSIQFLSERLLRRWPSDALGGIDLLPRIEKGRSALKPHDVYHPVGTCRMGLDDQATVDLDLRVRGTKNLFVLSTALFPSAGSANPTFSMLCLGDRLAAKLGEVLGRPLMVRAVVS